MIWLHCDEPSQARQTYFATPSQPLAQKGKPAGSPDVEGLLDANSGDRG